MTTPIDDLIAAHPVASLVRDMEAAQRELDAADLRGMATTQEIDRLIAVRQAVVDLLRLALDVENVDTGPMWHLTEAATAIDAAGRLVAAQKDRLEPEAVDDTLQALGRAMSHTKFVQRSLIGTVH